MTVITAVWSESSFAFPKNGTATGSGRERSSNGGQRRDKSAHISTTHHQGDFQHNYFVVVSLHHGDHGSVFTIFVGHSEVVKHLLEAKYFLPKFKKDLVMACHIRNYSTS